jgi:uncharacterized protein (DUF1810 family)
VFADVRGMTLERFKEAQNQQVDGFEAALAELRAGRKTSHWIWYIFPQLATLGRSSTARFYALQDLAEAREYLRDPVLLERLLRATETVADKLIQGVRVTDLMGGALDSQKLVSSLTLFESAAATLSQPGADPIFARFGARCAQALAAAEQQGFPRCAYTQAEISGQR